jgi:hypothetical protein
VHKWRRALEAAGVEFIDGTDTSGPGVRAQEGPAEAVKE